MSTLRSRLFHGTAVAAALTVMPQAVLAAPALPTGGVVAAGTVTATPGVTNTSAFSGTGTVASPFAVSGTIGAPDALTFTVGTGAAHQSAIVNWDSFNIGSTAGTNNVVNFAGTGGLAFSVLNRVNAGGSPTTIAGSINGGGNGTIFVINEAGISFAGSAKVTNLSGFVASSLGVTDLDFTAYATGANTPVHFTPTSALGTDAPGISTAASAQISPDSVLLLVAPSLAIAGGSLTAASGDAGFVLAGDATVTLNPTSIIAIKLDAGVAVSTAQTLAGTISGKRVLVAAASSADLTSALLGVSADLTATTATASAKGIVIAIGRDAPIDSTNSITFTPPALQFNAGASVTGTLATTKGGDIALSSSGASSIGGDVTSTGAFTATAASLGLGTATEPHLQSATGAVTLRSTAGGIAANGTLTIAANSDGAGGEALILDSADSITNGAALKGGTTAQLSPIGIRLGSQSAPITLGAVTGSALGSVDYVIPLVPASGYGAVATTLATAGDITVGAVTVTNAASIQSTGGSIVGGVITSTANGVSAVALGAGKTVTIAGAASGGVAKDVTVSASGLATVSGAVTSTGDYTVTGGGVSLVGAQTAVGNVLIQSATGDISATGSLTADNAGTGNKRLVLDSFAAIIGGANLAAGTAHDSDILIRVGAGQDVTLGSIDARQLSGATSLVPLPLTVLGYVPTTNLALVPTLSTSGAISLGAVATTTSNAIGSTGSASVSIGGDTSTTGSVEVSATNGDVTLSGPVSAHSFANLHADLGTLTVGSVSAFGAVALVGGDATLVGKTAIVEAAGAPTIAALGNVSLTSNGAIGVGAVRAGGTITAGGVTGLNAVSLTGDSLRAGGAVMVNTSGIITLTGANATSAQSVGFDLNPTTLTFNGPNPVAAADVTLASTGGAVTVNDVTSTANIVGTGTTFTLGTASATHALNAAGAVTLTAIDTGAATVTALGNYAITGTGAVALKHSDGTGANVVHDDTLAITGKNVLVGDIALAATLPTLVGTGDVTLTANGAATTDSVTAGVVTARNAVTVSSANGAVTLGGATSDGAASDVRVTAAGAAAVSGNVTATGSYFVKGSTVSVGGAGTSQTAIGDVLIQATGGDLTTQGTIVSDNGAAPTGAHPLVLDSFGSITGGANLRAGAMSLTGIRSNVLLRVEGDLVLGDIDANVFAQTKTPGFPATAGAYAAETSLKVEGAITLGTVRTVASNDIESLGTVSGHREIVLAGDTSSTGYIILGEGQGDVTINGPVSAQQFVEIRTAGTIRAASVRSATGDVTISGTATASVGGSAGGALTIAAAANASVVARGDVALGDVRAGGTIYVGGGFTTGAASVTAGSLEANGAISVIATGPIDLTAGTTVATHRNLLDSTLTTFSGPPTALDANVALTSGGAITAKGLAATGSIALNGVGTVSVTGTVAAGDATTAGSSGNYTVVGGNAVIGGAGVLQTATGNVLIRSTATGIAAAGTLTAGGRLVLDSATSIGGIVIPGSPPLLATAKLVAGTDVLLRTASAAAIVLGDINANQLATGVTAAAPPVTVADYTAKVDGTVATLSTDGAITLGAVKTVQANKIVSTGAALGQRDVTLAGDITTGPTSSIDVGSDSGAVKLTGPVVATASVNLHADFTPASDDPTQGLLTVNSVTAAGGDATLTGGTGIATTAPLGVIAASGNVLLASPGAIAIGSAKAGGTIAVAGLAGVGSAGSLNAVGLQSNGAISVKTTGAIMLTGAGTAQTATERLLFNPTAGTFSGAAILTGADVTLTSTGSTVTIADAASTGNLTLSANGLASATGVVSVGDATTGAASGNYTVTGSNITLGGAGVIQSATGGIFLTSAGAIAVDTLRAGGTIAAAGPVVATIPTSAASLTGISLQANGAIIVSTTGPINLTGTGTAQTATERKLFDPIARTFSGAAIPTDHDVTLASSTGTIMVADLASTGNIALSGGAISVTGTVAAGDGSTLGGSGNYTVVGSSIALGGGVAGQAALGDIVLQTPGAITLTALRSGGTITARGVPVGVTPTNAASLVGDSLQANGAITVATTGVITLAGLNATSIATQRQRIAPDLQTFTGFGTVPDANIALTTTAGTITVHGGSSTGNTTLMAGTGGASGGIAATGNLTAGDGTTAATLGDIVLDGHDLTSLALATATRNISVTSHANNATIGTVTAGTAAAGGTITAQSLAANGQATITSGTTTLGDVKALATATGGIALITSGTAHTGNVLADGDASATITIGTTLGAVATGDVTAHSQSGDATVTTGQARGNVVANALNAALVGNGTSVNADVSAISRSTTGGSATITLANAHNITADAQFGPAHIGSAQSLVSGNIAATVHTGGNLASIATATASGGTVTASQLGSGSATIGTATASGSVSAIAGGLADITTSGTSTGADVIASGGSAHIALAQALGNVRALASNGSATVDSGTATNGNVDALATTAATITAGTAGSNVRATSSGGLATIATGIAGQSVIANGNSVVVGAATAGDDIILAANSGTATATTLTVTGLGADVAATDASGVPLTFGGNPLTGVGGSNAIIRASGAATVSGVVSVTQANAAKTANYDIQAASVTLGTAGVPLNQGAAGRVDIATTTGGVTFAPFGGSLQSNVGGKRTANALADGTTAGGGLTIASATGIAGATTDLIANAKTSGVGFDTQARQPGVVLAAAPGGHGTISLASITGGAVTVTGPAAITVPLVTATGNVSLTGVTSSTGNDTATIIPTTITIDGLNAGYARVNVTAAGGAGAEVALLNTTRGGQVGALQILSDTGAATLRSAPSDPTKISSILVESQTGVAGILNTAGGVATTANPNTVAAQTVVLRGRQAGSSVLVTGPLLATGSILATGPTVTIGTVAVAGSSTDGPGDISIAATGAASLATGATETATARRSITLTAGGAATLGDGTATSGTLAVRGATVTIARQAIAGDDVLLTSGGALTATTATISTTGTADLQGGDDTLTVGLTATGTQAGTGYGTGHTVITDAVTPATDAVTANSLNHLGGANIVATAAGNIDFSAATLNAPTATLARDIRVESGGTIALAAASAARQLVAASAGNLTATSTLTAGDDLVLVSGGAIDVHTATLRTVAAGAGLSDARRGDGTFLTNAAAGGSLTSLGGSNIALAATGAIQLGAISTTGAAPSSLRAFSAAAITTTQAIATTGSIALVGATVSGPFALTAGDDIVAVARGGTTTLGGVLTTTAANSSNAALVDLGGNGIALPGEAAALGRVDGSSILVAATGLSTVSANVTSAGRYSVYGRGGITLGTDAATPPGTTQTAAGDILLEASIGAAPPAASVTLANNMVLTANSDGVEAASGSGFIADPLVVRLGNGSLNAAGATLRVLRTATALLTDQGTVQVQPVIADGVKSIAIATLDTASADLRALNNVTVGSAKIDGGLTLASKAGAVSLTTLTVGTAVPLMTPAQVAAIDLKLSAATGATLGNVVAGANQLRDITVATTGGTASITGAAAARDDIVVASTTGAASAGDLSFVGTVSDSEAGIATVAATDANNAALADPYRLTGLTITGLAGRNIVVSGATAAALGTVTTAATGSLGDVRVLTAAGPATLTTVNTGGLGLPARVIVATRNGAATGTTLNASGDIIVDATIGSATLTTGNAGRDGIVVAPTVSIGTLTAGDDIVAVATGGTLTAGTLTSTGANSGDAIATIFRSDGTPVPDPIAGGNVGGLLGGNVVALGTGNVTVTTATAAAPVGAAAPGFVRIASQTGAVLVTGATATAGDLILTGATVTTTTLRAGRDASITASGLATLPLLTAGRDVTITAGSALLGTGVGGLVAAQRNFLATTSGALTIGTARAGGTLGATGGSVLATTLGAGDALTVSATAGDATVTSASSTGLPLLADFSGFATAGTAAGSTRNISVAATGLATLTTGVAVHSITVTGTTGLATTATANTGGTDGDLTVTGTTGGASLGTGSARDIRVAATGGGAAAATTATASRDLYVDASGGAATLVTGVAGRDGVVVGPAVSIGSLTAGDDIVAVASAGTLTATTLTSTGANSSDTVATITRASGAAIADPVAGGSVGGLTGGNVVALGSGNVTVATVTATAPAGATVPGLVRLASLNGTTAVTTATASAGDIILSGVAVNGGTLSAGRDATVTATGSDINVATITTGRDLVLTGANDIVVAGSSTVGGMATLTAVRDISLGATATGDALDTVGTATLVSGRDIVVAQRIGAGAALGATAGGAATLAGTGSGGTTTIATQGNLTLTADAVATGALTLTSAAGSITSPNLTGNGITLTAANAIAASGATTSTGALNATAGSLAFGSVAATLDATLHATGALGVTGTTVTGGALTATSDAGAIGTGAVMTGGPSLFTAANATNGAIVLASLTTTGSATFGAGQSAEVTGLAKTSGALTATAASGSLKFGSIDAGAAATLRARTALTVAGLAKSGAALDALSSAGALSFGSTQAATTVTLRGATGVVVTGGTTSGGTATITADAGPIATGDINAGGDTLVTATGGSATLGSVSRTGKLTVTAATDAAISGGVTTTGDTAIAATNGSATIGGAVKTANYTVKANNGTIALGAGVIQASSGTMTLDSQRLTIGAGTALVAPTRIQLDVTGNAAGVSLGDGPGAAAGTTKYTLSKADLRKFQTPTFEIAAVGRSVDIGEVDLDTVAPVTGGFAGITGAFGIRTTGDIRIADRLTFTSAATATTPRVLTLGGAAGGADLDKTTTTANAIKVLAISGLDNSTTGTGGQINAAGSTVQLRATYVALGETPSPAAGRPFIDALLPASGTPLTTAQARTQFVDNASSTLYVAIPPYAKQVPTPQALVKAGTLVLAPGQWALIQNTGPSTTPGGGIDVGVLKFNKVAGASSPDPEIAVFGSVAGKTGVASAISIASSNLDGISPNNIRVNGCVALSTAGCIQSAIAIPLINLADPGRTLLISSAPDLALSVELITGATNEALWREDDDCAPGAEGDRCPAARGQKSPQKESRP